MGTLAINDSLFIGVGDARTRRNIRDEIERVVGLNVTFTATSTTKQFDLGTRREYIWGSGNDKRSEVVYIQATGGALTAGLLYELPLIGGTDAFKVDTAITTTVVGALTATGDKIAACIPLSAIAQDSYGWAFVRGHVQIETANAVAANVKVYSTATAGKIDDVSTSSHLVDGLQLVAAAGSATTAQGYALFDLHVTKTV